MSGSVKDNIKQVIVQRYNEKYPEESLAIAKGLVKAADELEIQPFMIYPYSVTVTKGADARMRVMGIVRDHINHTQAFIHALGFAKVEIDCDPENIKSTSGLGADMADYTVEIRIRISDFIL